MLDKPRLPVIGVADGCAVEAGDGLDHVADAVGHVHCLAFKVADRDGSVLDVERVGLDFAVERILDV